MILFSILAAVGACTILTLLDAFYDSIIKWISQIGNIAKKIVKGVLIGCKTFISNIHKNLGEEISKNYSKVGDKWQVTEVTREISSNEIPEEIYERMEQESSDSLELTKDIEEQLLKNYQ